MAGPRVRFEALIENPDILFGLMADAQCLVFPSLVEAMSMVLLEAASINVPIVCSDIPENRKILHDEAVYFQSDNVQDLIDQLEWVINHPNETSQLSHRAQESVNSEFSWDSIASRYADLYQEVMNTP
jgi:glycosyltransferase involved in cell wall biosynthesis